MTVPDVIPKEQGGLTLLAELERTGALTKTSLTLPPGLPYEQYEALFGMFGELHEMTCWVIGDLINYGEKVYGETYAQAVHATGLAEQTLTNYASVCNRIPRSRRRPPNVLKFSVHAEVAYMPPAEQEKWLKEAASNKWKRRDLREALAPIRAAENGRPPRDSSIEILPPAVESHLCHCHTCGRSHRDDVDVTE